MQMALSGYQGMRAPCRKYIDDPDCGFVLTAGSPAGSGGRFGKKSVHAGVAENPESVAYLCDFPALKNPVHGGRKDLNRMLSAFEQQGLMSVDVNWYAAAGVMRCSTN